LEFIFDTASGGCAAIGGGSPAKLPGFEILFRNLRTVLKSTFENLMTGVILTTESHG
jgi:hypothetical protein